MKRAFDLYRSFLEPGTEGLNYDTISKSMRMKQRYAEEREHSGYANDEHFSWFGENKELLFHPQQNDLQEGKFLALGSVSNDKWGQSLQSIHRMMEDGAEIQEIQETAMGTNIPAPRCNPMKEANQGAGVPDGQASREDSEVQEPSAAVQQVHPGRAIVLAGVDRRRREVCQTCFASFKRAHDLRRHEFSTHTDERPFKCDVCNQKFSRADNLRQHEKIHKKNRPAKS